MSRVATAAEVVSRRCFTCGARVPGDSCDDCGRPLEPRMAIGVLNGVGVNFGSVQNVYNISAAVPELLDPQGFRDGLNRRSPEGARPALGDGGRSLRPSDGAIRVINAVAFVLFTAVILSVVSLFWHLL